jgi:PAS domain S-box-containing protein
VSTIGIRQQVARRIEATLRELKPEVLSLWAESVLEKSGRFRFTNPLPGPVYTRLLDEFVDVLCDSLSDEDLDSAEAFWPGLARGGLLGNHQPFEVAHLCATACRSIAGVMDRATTDAEDGLNVRAGLEQVLARIRQSARPTRRPPVEEAAPARLSSPESAQPPTEFDALVRAADSLRQGLAWSDLYQRDVQRSRRLESLRVMLLEVRGLAPAKASQVVLRRLYDELPCRGCLFVRLAEERRALRLESAWPAEGLGRELGEEIALSDGELARFPTGLEGTALPIEHKGAGLDAELAGFGARAMFVVRVPKDKEPDGWLVIGTDGDEPLPLDDAEFAQTAAVLGAVLDNAVLSNKLRSAVRRLRNVVRAAPEPILLLDPAGVVLDLSQAAAKALGSARSDLVRMDLAAKGVLGERDELKSLLAGMQARSGVVSRLLTARRSDGTTFRAACSMAALDDWAVMLVFHDVTRMAREAEARRDAEARTRALLDCAGDVVFLLDREGRCLDAGEGALAAYGLDRAQALGRKPSELLDEQAAASFLDAVRGVLESGAPTVIESTLTAHGQNLTFQTSLSPLRSAAGDIIGVLCIAREVTAARRAEQPLVESERITAVGALLASLAHDLNNRLGPVIGHAQMLQHRKIGIGEMAHVNAIERCGQAAKRLVESLLAYANPPPPALRLCDINAVVRETFALVEPQYRARGITVALELNADIPATLVDAGQLAHVFLNLFNNALEAMGERGGQLAITTSLSDSTISVCFADTGEGIAAGEIERIFEPFYTTKQGRSSAGLGLTIARAIVRGHGGSIAVESKPGQGAAFRIELPRRAPRHARPLAPPRLRPTRPLRILLLDEDAEMLAMMKKLLGGVGHRVVACATACETLQALRASSFDVVVADVGLSGLGGAELHAWLSAERPELASRLVFTAAQIPGPRTREFIRASRSRLVQKPFNVHDLLGAVADAAPPQPTRDA